MNISRLLSTSKFSAIMASIHDENPDLSLTSPGEESDAILSPQQEVEPIPGLNGVPVRCTWQNAIQHMKSSLSLDTTNLLRVRCRWRFLFMFDWYMSSAVGGPNRVLHADNALPGKTRHKCRVSQCVRLWIWAHLVLRRFFYNPLTLSALACGLLVLAYVATTQDVLEEGQDKRRVYVCLLKLCIGILSAGQGGLRSNSCIPDVFHDSVPWRTFYSASSCVLANSIRNQSFVWVGARVPPLSRSWHCTHNDDIYRFKSGGPAPWKKLRGRLCTDRQKSMGAV